MSGELKLSRAPAQDGKLIIGRAGTGSLHLKRISGKTGALWLGRQDHAIVQYVMAGDASGSYAMASASIAYPARADTSQQASALGVVTLTYPAIAQAAMPTTADGSAQYDNAVFRGPAHASGNAWQDGIKRLHSDAFGWRDSAIRTGRALADWRNSDLRQQVLNAPWLQMADRATGCTSDWRAAATLCKADPALWRSQFVRQTIRDAIWQEEQTKKHASLTSWHQETTQRNAAAMPWNTTIGKAGKLAIKTSSGTGIVIRGTLPWGEGQRRADFIAVQITPPNIPIEHSQSTDLWLLRRPSHHGALWLGRIDIPSQIVVPVRKVYLVQNKVRIATWPADADLEGTSVQLSIDVDSYVWSFNAELAPSAAPLIAPDRDGEASVLRITVNGYHWLVMAENISRSREFGKTGIRASGRGLAARLGNPYSAAATWANTSPMTAQQLAGEALKENGVPIGWAIDWQLADWLIPTGAQSYQGERIGAIDDILHACGGYIQADRESQTLHLQHRYPLLPRDWPDAIPDLILPPDIIQRESTEWRDRPRYDAVYVSGAEGGVLGHVTIRDSGGTREAPAVLHRLITDAVSARQKGRAILGDTGRQARVSIDLPLSTDTGLLSVGNMVRINETGDVWQGMVRGVNVTARWPTVTQSLELERHCG